MATYKIIGQRYLRMYTANRTTPVYAASTDVKTIVNSLCDVPWEKVRPASATMTYHTEENVGTDDEAVSGLEMNVLIRDEFDAALFCAEHSGGQHRAYANAAVYRYTLPDEAVGVSLSSLKLAVTSDPYNANGARIHVMTNSTGVIPTNCHTCRGEDSSGTVVEDGTTAIEVAPRTATTVSSKTYWYPTSATCTISPTGGLTLQKYLFVFVLMENYATVRGNWIEGCSYIENLVTVTTASAVSGWTDGETVNLSEPEETALTLPVVRDGILPYVPSGSPVGEAHVIVRADANFVIEADGSQTESRTAAGNGAAAALGRLYARLFDGDFDRPTAESASAAPGAAFNFLRTTESHLSAGDDMPSATDVLRLDAASLVIPFSYPNGFSPSTVRFDYGELDLPDGARFNVFLASGYLLALTDDQLKNPGLYDGVEPPFTLLGKITSGTSATFSLPSGKSRVGTFVITGFFPPERCSLTSSARQGTGLAAFLPNVTLIA